MTRKWVWFLSAVLALGLLATGCLAQEVTASLTGTVTDSTGAVVPGASVVIHNNATNTDVRTVVTDNSGVYSADLLPYGTYTVSIKKQGFQNYVARDVILHVGDHRTLNAQLQAGGVGKVLGPGRDDWDFGLFKNTRLSECFSTQFRAEFFNVFNITSFSAVQNDIDLANEGRVAAAHDPRIIQLGMKLYF